MNPEKFNPLIELIKNQLADMFPVSLVIGIGPEGGIFVVHGCPIHVKDQLEGLLRVGAERDFNMRAAIVSVACDIAKKQVGKEENKNPIDRFKSENRELIKKFQENKNKTNDN